MEGDQLSSHPPKYGEATAGYSQPPVQPNHDQNTQSVSAPPGYPPPGYAQPAHPGGGYAQPAYPGGGYAQPAHPGGGYAQPAYPGGGYAQPAFPQAGYAQPAAAGYAPFGQAATVIVQPAPGQPVVVAPGRCRECNGYMREDFTQCGIILAIICFPIGLLCCLVMRERKCTSCGNVI